MASPGGGGCTSGSRCGDQSLRDSPCPSHLLQLSWDNYLALLLFLYIKFPSSIQKTTLCNIHVPYQYIWLNLNTYFNILNLKLLSWRRITYLTPGNPSVTCLCRTIPSMDGTSCWPFDDGERKLSGIAWLRRRHGRGKRMQSQLMGFPYPRSPSSIVWVELSEQWTATVQQWSENSTQTIEGGDRG